MIPSVVVLEGVLHHQQFDPYPFIALNLMWSAMAGLQAPIILAIQDRASARGEVLAAHHCDASTKMDELMEPLPGDIFHTRPEEVHFHGGSPEAPTAHLAVNGAGAPVWGAEVTDAEYGEGSAGASSAVSGGLCPVDDL